MTDKQSEMSIDEVLSSIKQMVIDKDPPVLELTDMISPDGAIIKVKQSETEKDMKTFLRLAQENGAAGTTEEQVVIKTCSPVKEKKIDSVGSGSVLGEIIKEVATPLVREWLAANLPEIVRAVVAEEVRRLMSNEKN